MPKQWSIHRPEIESLYCAQNKPLHEVASYMLNKHGFAASTRSYRSHIREWGLKRRYRSRACAHRKGSATSTSSNETTSTVATSIDEFSDLDNSSGDETIQAKKEELTSELSQATARQTELNMQMLARLNTNIAYSPRDADLSISPTESVGGRASHAVFSTFAPLLDRVMEEDSPTGTSESLEDSSPLSRAVRLGLDDLASLLLSYGANPNERVGCYGRTALHQAVFYGRISTIQTILDHGAHVNIQDSAALSPLHQAVSKLKNSVAMADVIRLLVARNADVNLEDNFGRTAFCHLLQIPRDTHYRFPCRLYSELVYLFLQKGACISRQCEPSFAFKHFLDALVGYAEAPSSGNDADADGAWPHEDGPLRQTVTLFLRGGADAQATRSEAGDTLLEYILGRAHISEQIASVARLLFVHADAKERALGGDGSGSRVLTDQREMMSLMASEGFWIEALDRSNLHSSQLRTVEAS